MSFPWPFGGKNAQLSAMQASLNRIENLVMTESAGVTSLQAADAVLQAEVAQLLTDFSTAIANAGNDPAAIAQVVTDMQTMAANITGADPTDVPPVTPPVTPPSS